MRYVVERYNEKQRDTAYRICISDSLRLLTKNTALLNSVHQIEGVAYTKRWADFLMPQKEETETRSAQEIIDHIKDGLRRISE